MAGCWWSSLYFACLLAEPKSFLAAILTEKARSYIPGQNHAILAVVLWERSCFVQKVLSRSPGWSVHMGTFSSRLSIGYGFPCEHIVIFYKEKSGEAKPTNRVSPFDRAHMKGPFYWSSKLLGFLFHSDLSRNAITFLPERVFENLTRLKHL